DGRLKKNIKTIDSKLALERITNLRGVTYEWNDTITGTRRPKGIQYGFIAQELMEEFPEHVSMDSQGYYQTAYGTYDALYVQAFKEQQKQINALSAENELLKKKLAQYESLESRIAALEQRSREVPQEEVTAVTSEK
ncbi:MAG: tail fiber domain-containing protein, partial [Marinirhabdus sp.]|nr:tail fiber domain-containing protein [Marinirhabdus sp.]